MTEHRTPESLEYVTLERQLDERNLAPVVERLGLAVQEGILAPAFARAIIAGFDEATRRGVVRLTKLQAAQEIINDPAAAQDLKRRARASMDALLDRRDKDLQLVDRRELESALQGNRILHESIKELGADGEAKRQRIRELEQQLANALDDNPPEYQIDKLVQLRVGPGENPGEENLQFYTFTATRAEVIGAGIAALRDRTHPDYIEWRDAVQQLATRGEPGQIRDMALLIARLSYQLNKARPGNEFSRRAAAYLKQHDLIGSPLRAQGMELRSTEGDAAEQLQQALATLQVLRDPVTAAHYAMSQLTDEGIADYLYDHHERWPIIAGEVERLQDEGQADLESAKDAQLAHDIKVTDQRGMLERTMGESLAGIVRQGEAAERIMGDIILQGAGVGEVSAEGIERVDPNTIHVANDAMDDSGMTQLPYQGAERRGVKIPGAVWPEPGKVGFTMARDSDPLNTANRHMPLKSRHDD